MSEQDEVEKKIRKAAEEGKITFASTDDVSQLDDVIADFLWEILELRLEDCFVSDESQLSDFVGCGISLPEADSYEATRSAWGEAILKKVKEKYGISVSVSDSIVSIAEKLSSCQPVNRPRSLQ